MYVVGLTANYFEQLQSVAVWRLTGNKYCGQLFSQLFFAKLSFNFNYNLVESESWDGYILNFPTHHPGTYPPTTYPEKYGMTSASTANFVYNFNYNF